MAYQILQARLDRGVPIPGPPGPPGADGVSPTPYVTTVTGLTTLTVTAATHGRGLVGVASCFDNATPANHVDVAWTRAANGDITFYWANPFTGTVQIN